MSIPTPIIATLVGAFIGVITNSFWKIRTRYIQRQSIRAILLQELQMIDINADKEGSEDTYIDAMHTANQSINIGFNSVQPQILQLTPTESYAILGFYGSVEKHRGMINQHEKPQTS